MADRPEREGGESEDAPRKVRPVVPPVVAPVAKPIVPPIVPPVAKPVAPPTVAPVARPVVPPTVAPVAKPVVPPTVAPVAKPVVPPTVAPVARPVVPPTVAPVGKPIAPPTVAPVSRPVTPVPPRANPVVAPTASPRVPSAPAPPTERRAPSSRREGAREDRAREHRAVASTPDTGMSVGPKVMLACGITAVLAMLAAVAPSLTAKGGDASADESYHSAGIATVRALAATVGDASATAVRPDGRSASKPTDRLVEDIEARLKALRISGDDLSNLTDELAVVKGLAAGRPDAAKNLDGLIGRIQKRIADTADAEDKQKLIDQRNRLVELQGALAGGGGAPAPAEGEGSGASGDLTSAALSRMVGGGAGPYQVRAVWITTTKRDRYLGQSDAATLLPAPSNVTDVRSDGSLGYYSAGIGSTPVTIFFARTHNFPGLAHVAMDVPPASASTAASSPLPLVMLVLGPVAVALVGLFVANAHNKPLKDLARELDRLGASGDPARRIPASGGEARSIARSVERMVSNLKFRDQHQMADLQEVVAKEQGVAAEIHHGLMPKNPPRLAGWEVETLFKPGFEIGGDHFDYFRIDDTHLGVIILDTSVRGVSAALVVAMARAYIRSTAPGVLSPAEVLTKVNRLLASDLSQGQYVTALYAVIDTANGTAKIASAGHLPLIVYRHAQGETAVVNPEGIALGLDVGPVFERTIRDEDVPIGVGDRLVLHTDGALNVQDETGDEFGEERLYAAIRREAPKNSQAFVNFVGAAIDAFHGTTPQNDDVTISTVKRLK